MEIKHSEADHKGQFFIEHAGTTAARMTYSKAGKDRIIIDHTEVEEVLRGKGAGKQLVMAAVAHAREHGLTILPLCPFAKSVFDKTKSIRDVIA